MNLKNNKEPMQIESTLECIEALAKLVKENDLGKLKISTDEIDITIEGKRCPPPMPPMGMTMGMPQSAPMASQEAPAPAAEVVSGNIITSPIVGTFYSSPSPEKPSFVDVGKVISAGDVVCIIESMKMMNEINSEFSGKVAEIYVRNGDTVEYGQKLMRIE